jgi:hypothetical protein
MAQAPRISRHLPPRTTTRVAQRPEIEMTDRPGIERAIISQDQGDRCVELPEAAQHPILPYVDLALAVHALIFAMGEDVALRFCPPRSPAIISSMLCRRTRSNGSPVKTWIHQGCVVIEDGARLATSMIVSIMGAAPAVS